MNYIIVFVRKNIKIIHPKKYLLWKKIIIKLFQLLFLLLNIILEYIKISLNRIQKIKK